MSMRHDRPVLFVTGGHGYLGRHIVARTSPHWHVVAPPSTQLDLRDARAVLAAVAAARPAAIVHTAYRRDDEAAIVAATDHVARAAERNGSRLVHVSTDALFAGRDAPYVEDDPPSAVHAYGRAKAEAERIVAARCDGAAVVRTSLIVGRSEPSVHELAVRDAVEGRSSMTFFTDEVRSPVLVEELADALLRVAADATIAGVLHLGGPQPLSRAELARLIAHRHGWAADRLRFTTIAESGLTRPGHVVLDSSRAASIGIAVGGPAEWV